MNTLSPPSTLKMSVNGATNNKSAKNLQHDFRFKLNDFSSFISGRFKRMFENDVKFVLGKDVTVPAHKSIVVLHSKYLQDLLLSYNDSSYLCQ